jgi:hypothetical protein
VSHEELRDIIYVGRQLLRAWPFLIANINEKGLIKCLGTAGSSFTVFCEFFRQAVSRK